jgi:tetratricopeptide (TPR) repeat protein
MVATHARGWLVVLLASTAVARAEETAPAPVTLGSEAAVAAARAHFMHGEALYRDARSNDALLEFRAAYALDPRPELLINIAQAERRLGLLDEAIADCERFLQRAPGSPLAARVKQLRKELRAERAAASAQAAATEGAASFAAGDYEHALAAYQRAYMDNIDEARYLVRLAECYRALHRTAEALRFYRLFLTERPDAPERASVEASIGALEQPPPTAPPVAPAVAASGAVATPAVTATKRPLWRRWWLWTAVGGVAALGIGLGVGLGTRTSGAGSFMPTLPPFGPSGQALTVAR